MLRSLCLIFTGLFIFPLLVLGQSPAPPSSVKLYNDLKKLNFLGTALYIAAHPDDENTRLISYLSNHLHARTAYLSMTRGDGGQNLIGTELRELLGVLRTQELLAARRIDGGEQFFTRATVTANEDRASRRSKFFQGCKDLQHLCASTHDHLRLVLKCVFQTPPPVVQFRALS